MTNSLSSQTLRYPFLISDIDGTLVGLDSKPDKKTISAIHRSREEGLRISFASGRNRLEILWYLEKLGIEEPYIALGGAYVGDPRSEKPLFQSTLSRDAVEHLLLHARRLELDIVAEYPDHLIYEFHCHFMQEFSRLSSPVSHVEPGEYQPDELPGKMVLVGSERAMATMQSALGSDSNQFEHTLSRPNVLDITSPEIHKGRALQVLASDIDAPLVSIAAVGDGGNDVSMLSTAGLSIAMGNSGDALKDIADLVAPPQEEHGFIWAIDKLLDMRV